MSVIRLILNVIWLFCGGLVMALGWWLAGIILFITIIGIPFARSCFVIGELVLWPFGQSSADRDLVKAQHDLGTGALGTIGNIIWFIFAGVWLAIGHMVLAVTLFVSIIGIPFAIQHFKLAKLTLAPIGQTVYTRAY